MSHPIYQLEQIEKRYGEALALRIPTLTIESGSITGLVGPNGSGKSTLLRLLAFIEKPSHGEILFRDDNPGATNHAARLRVTLLDQEPYLLRRSVAENVAYGLRIRNDTERLQDRIGEALGWVGLAAGEYAHRKWYQLSGGEMQRVALAARLILKPRVLLLDEPTASVDADSARLIREASLRARRQWQTTLVIASHDWQWLHEVCDEILHLLKGCVAGPGLSNVIFGPWLPLADGDWQKLLPAGQSLRVVAPPQQDSIAVIAPGDLTVVVHLNDSTPRRDNALVGVLSNLAYHKRTEAILATVVVENLTLTASVPPRQAQTEALFPGQKVWVVFDADTVRWI